MPSWASSTGACTPYLSCVCLQHDLQQTLGLGERGGSPEKVLPNPTWAVFALSGLAASLIDNWP